MLKCHVWALRQAVSLIIVGYIYTLVYTICLKTGQIVVLSLTRPFNQLDNYDGMQKKFDQLTRDVDARIGATIDRLGDTNGHVSRHTDLVLAARSAIAVRVNL